MKKLSEEWRLYELYCQYHFEKTCREGKAGKVREKIVNVATEVLNKDTTRLMISENDFEELGKDLIKFRNQFVHSEFGKISLLGPIGKEGLYSMGFLLDLDDITEVYLDVKNYRGCINSKKCGWIAWQLVKGDKSLIKKGFRVLIRLSGTEPLIRILVEGSKLKEVELTAHKLEYKVRSFLD